MISRSHLLMILFLVFLHQQKQQSICRTTISARAASSCLAREREALLDFKRYAFDPHHPATQFWLSSWAANPPLTTNSTSAYAADDCCRWRGVRCDAQGMVTKIIFDGCTVAYFNGSLLFYGQGPMVLVNDSIKLHAELNAEALRPLAAIHRLSFLDFACQRFHGPIAEEIGNLTSLTKLYVRENNMSGRLPASMRHLKSLEYLNLGNNQFSPQDIPSFVFELRSLQYLDLSYNKFTGAIPDALANLKRLTHLDLSSNSLSGAIPHVLADLKKLTELDLSNNKFTGAIPDSFANLQQLEELDLSNNQLDGPIPPSMLNLTSLLSLDLSRNNFTGAILDSFANLEQLEALYLSTNQLDGPIPPLMQNLTWLKRLDLSSNTFSGSIPHELTNLKQLSDLDLSNNNLSGAIPDSFADLTQLNFLDLSNNKFSGSIPDSFANLQQLVSLYLSDNQLNGPILPFIQNMTSLWRLDLSRNNFSGAIPDAFTGLNELEYLFLSSNQLDGPLPPSMHRLTSLRELNLGHNLLSGLLPPYIANFTSLQLLDLSNNEFLPQAIPSTLMLLPSLIILDVSFNNFTGIHRFPSDREGASSYDATSQLQYLNLAHNQLTDDIFESYRASIFQHLKKLIVLDLSYNQLEGLSFPPSSSMVNPELLILMMRNNRLQGPIPQFIQHLTKLEVMDLGWNELSGGVPQWIGSSRSQNLRVLILAGNQLTGAIPASLGLLSAMQKNDSIDQYSIQINVDLKPDVGIPMNFKGQNRNLQLHFITALDLSKNKLSGPIPPDLGKLRGLVSLNLSRNQLDGEIPATLGNLTNLESLDLSSNELEGHIPDSFNAMDSLGFVNMSRNHLTGRIPTSPHWDTFNVSAFLDNVGLCTANANTTEGLPTCASVARTSPTISGGAFVEGIVEWGGFMVGYPLGFLLGSLYVYILVGLY